MFRESASSFVSPEDTTFFDGSSHLFPTRSLLTPSAAYLTISFTSMRVVFAPRRFDRASNAVWFNPAFTVSDAQSNKAEWRPAVSLMMLHVNGAAVNCIASCAGSAGCRKTLHQCQLLYSGLFSLILAALVLATLAASSLMTAFIDLESCVWAVATMDSQTEWTELH